MSEADVMATEYWHGRFTAAQEVLKSWIRDCNDGHIKIAGMLLTAEQTDLARSLLMAVDGDISILAPAGGKDE